MPRELPSPRGRKTYRSSVDTNSSPKSKTSNILAKELESSTSSESETDEEDALHNSRDNYGPTKSSKRSLSPSPASRNRYNLQQAPASRTPSPVETFRSSSISSKLYKEKHVSQSFLLPAPKQKSKLGLYFITSLAVLLIAFVMVVALDFFHEKTTAFVWRNCSGIDELKEKYPSQDTYLWRAVKTGIEGVINGKPPKPSIFLFLHHYESSTKRIVNEIVNAAAVCFDPKLKPVILDSDEFNSEDILSDYGTVIEQYQKALKKGGVVFIADLNKINPKAARALHFICDNENPLINNVVIFLTLESVSDVGKPVEIAEETLNSIWSGNIDNNSLGALIARVTDQVIQLYPE